MLVLRDFDNLSLPSRRHNPKGNHVANALIVVRAMDVRKRKGVIGRIHDHARIINFTTGHPAIFNFSYRKVGGLRFIKLGRFTFMFCISREYKPL